MKIRGVDFIVYPVSDLARAAQFYREVLGLRQEIYSDEYQWAEFACGNVTLALHGGNKTPVEPGGRRLAFAVDDIAAAYDELKAAAVRMPGKPEDHGVCRHLDVFDPDGNPVMLHQRADGTWGQNSPAAGAR